jgi:hypothetical protein
LHAISILFMPDPSRVEKSFDCGLANLEHKVATGKIVDSDQSLQQGKFGLGHVEACVQHRTIVLCKFVFHISNELFKSIALQQRQVRTGSGESVGIIALSFERERSDATDQRDETAVAVPSKDGLGDIPLVLLV